MDETWECLIERDILSRKLSQIMADEECPEETKQEGEHISKSVASYLVFGKNPKSAEMLVVAAALDVGTIDALWKGVHACSVIE